MFDFGSLFGGIGSFLGGQATASGYKAAAKGYDEAARITQLSGLVKDNMMRRAAFQLHGTAVASTAGNGLALSGSSLDVIRSNTQQMGLSKALTDLNTKMEYESYKAQAAQARAMAKSSSIGGIFGLIGGVLGMFSDDDLKDEITLEGRRGDGIGIYTFRYKGAEGRWRGVLASEIEALRPDAIVIDGDFRRVNYDLLQIPFEQVTNAASANL